ncbi:hypothetical protein D9615_009032 [Tricholomella constricta]|uniref:Uncharacterized protein n=1 Tax=Tricholomella constricta TaxID=117010 RepID=A0A8H5H0S4_9AGAR|nr:hypothetical protein D9615_009032 [Tricholomella constricta]
MSESGTERTNDPEPAPTSTTTLRQITNPFIALQGINPLRWPQSLITNKEICSPLQDQFLPRKDIDIPKGARPLDCPFNVDRLRTMQQTGDTRETLVLIPALLDLTVEWLCELKEVGLGLGTGETLKVANRSWDTVPYTTGAVIDGIPIYQYTDAHHRHASRTGKVLDDWDDIDEIEPPYTEQDVDHVDICDLEVLLMMAQEQMYWGVPVEWNDGNYTVHIMYPTTELTQLIVITAHIPHETALAVQEGHPTMKMIKVTRDIIDIGLLQADDDLYRNTDLFKVLVGMVEHGIKVANMVPYGPAFNNVEITRVKKNDIFIESARAEVLRDPRELAFQHADSGACLVFASEERILTILAMFEEKLDGPDPCICDATGKLNGAAVHVMRLETDPFFTTAARDPNATYRVLYYRLTNAPAQTARTSGLVLHAKSTSSSSDSCTSLPHMPPPLVSWDEGLPLVPTALLLLHKLQA